MALKVQPLKSLRKTFDYLNLHCLSVVKKILGELFPFFTLLQEVSPCTLTLTLLQSDINIPAVFGLY